MWFYRLSLKNATYWQVRVVNVEKEKQVMEDVIRKLDWKENQNLPQVQLGTTEVHVLYIIMVDWKLVHLNYFELNMLILSCNTFNTVKVFEF